MKTYLNVNNSDQLKKGDVLVEFYYSSNEVWHTYKVDETYDGGVSLICPSNAIIYVKNEDLNKNKQYFKRLYN